jgi:hypothetical protein
MTKYNNCSPHVIPHNLIGKKTKGKKGIIAYNTSFEIGFMKWHVETKYLELINTHVVGFGDVKGNIRSQSRTVEGNKVVQPTKKCQKVTLGVIFTFFGSKTPYKK